MRLIDLNHLLQLVKKNAPFIYSILSPIAMLCPTIDAVGVVRCKDCRNWGYGVPGEGEKVRVCVVSAEIETPFDGFCHKGERSDDGVYKAD